MLQILILKREFQYLGISLCNELSARRYCGPLMIAKFTALAGVCTVRVTIARKQTSAPYVTLPNLFHES